MKAGTLLRIGIYLIGLWSLSSGVSAAVYYLGSSYSAWPADWGAGDALAPSVFGYAVVPLLFALMCFGFAGAITRLLLGARAEELVGGVDRSGAAETLIKLLGLYLIGMYGAAMGATFYELLAVRSGSRAFSEQQVTSDLIANGLAIVFGLWLALRTKSLLAHLQRYEKR